MHIVDEPIETVHLYVVREEQKQPYTALPLFMACVCLMLIAGLSLRSAHNPQRLNSQKMAPTTQITTSSIRIPPGLASAAPPPLSGRTRCGRTASTP